MATRRRRPDAGHAILREMADRGVYEPEEFDAWLSDQGMAWQALERGDYGLSLEEAMLAYVMGCPVRWAETFLVEPDTGDPYRLFDYQRESLRAWRQNVIHQDGAEVGKTREITVLILWACCTAMGGTTPNPWILVGAPQQTHLDEIILAVEEQVGAEGDRASGSILSQFWAKPKRTPHMMQRFIAPNPLRPDRPSAARVYYRPAGHDGEAFRGVHVNALALMDEAAKLKRDVQWTEFWRALKPGCRSRVYSVPDGDSSSGYYKQTQAAVADLPEGTPGVRLFRWPKTLMPPPFWTPSREAEMIQRYGGRHSPGYQRNVLGLHGQAENPVWPLETLLPNIADLPAYRVLEIAADAAAGLLSVRLRAVDLHLSEGRKSPRDRVLVDHDTDLAPYVSGSDDQRRAAMRALVREHLPGASNGVYWAGADLGETTDPTEIIISEQLGSRIEDRIRVRARGLPYHAQRELIYALAEHLSHLPHWGVDLGSAGTVVVRDLQTMDAYADAHFDEVMTGFQFSSSVDFLDESGYAMRDPGARDCDDERVLRGPAKHHATQLITARLQAVGYALAYDSEVIGWMSNHTARHGSKWPIYAKKDDHAIDARRVQILRKVFDEAGGAVDIFSSGVHARRAA